LVERVRMQEDVYCDTAAGEIIELRMVTKQTVVMHPRIMVRKFELLIPIAGSTSVSAD
jgi:hypothetical protein